MGEGPRPHGVRFRVPAREGVDGDKKLHAGEEQELRDVVGDEPGEEGDLVVDIGFVAAAARHEEVAEKSRELYCDERADEDEGAPLNGHLAAHGGAWGVSVAFSVE